ncbi:MAG TPA: CoA transferase [Pseudomonadales bacterium]|nr:CoA transferase [Pseudomonadales bacterium]
MTQPQPLAGIVVLDFGQIYNGPYCGFLLAMAGARVIKIESPQGESLRGRAERSSASYPFAMLNSNKDAITLNLKSERGRELLRGLVVKADVLLENFSPGTMDRLGVGADVLRVVNPRLIYAAATGFGRTGLHRDYLAMDITVQAMSGVMAITGDGDGAPLKAGPALCDFLGGIHLYSAIMTALFQRERTGAGAVVDVAMQDAVFPTLASAIGARYFLGRHPARTGNRHFALSLAPYNVYRARDGYVAIICIREGHWRNLVEAMRRPELLTDPRFADMAARAKNMDAVDATVEAWTSTLDKDAVFRITQAHDIICAPVQDLDDVLDDPHLHARGMLNRVHHPLLGDAVLPSTPLRFEGVEPPPLRVSRDLGADNEAVYGELLGLSPNEVARLRRDEAI